MTKAKVGHSALDPEVTVTAELAKLPDDEARLRFLQSAIDHAEAQLAIANDQYERVNAKADDVQEMWDAKVMEAHNIRVGAADTLEALNREHEALGG